MGLSRRADALKGGLQRASIAGSVGARTVAKTIEQMVKGTHHVIEAQCLWIFHLSAGWVVDFRFFNLLGGLEYEHGIAIAVKAIFLLDGFGIKFLEPLDALFAARREKGGH